ncbi:RloB family protein [Pseudomonas mercuritolerans]|uniref:RloB family protein n=1 Tax=Pseudomonas mercuritolerans TaxID=2951809 RepID=A0ABT2XPG6_9PSED|nr:RloB family protein [Pseudomonas mercuritolerans]MCV2220596.1 RloB family protein [Pseudomonas mercuritolerans]
MSLTSRKKRPLVRDQQDYRDDRLFIIASDDTFAPKQYFDAFEIPRIKVVVVPTTDGSSAAPHVLTRLDQFDVEEDDERWMLLDTDHYIQPNHAATFLQAITEARQKGIEVALSNPCFDFWLLLHHLEGGADLSIITDAKSVGVELRKKLGAFDKTKLNPTNFPLSAVAHACSIARAMDISVGGGDRPEGPTSRVYKLWESIVSKTPRVQLPQELVSVRIDQ